MSYLIDAEIGCETFLANSVSGAILLVIEFVVLAKVC